MDGSVQVLVLVRRDRPLSIQSPGTSAEPSPIATVIVSAADDPRHGRVSLVLADGRKFTLVAGEHIEEAEEW